MICKKCGQKYSEGSRYCENCGASLGEVLPKNETIEQPSNQQVSPGVLNGWGRHTEMGI